MHTALLTPLSPYKKHQPAAALAAINKEERPVMKHKTMIIPKFNRNSYFTLAVGALFCCSLWGMAPALIKTGYAVLNITSTGAILLFAGIRFVIAGLLVLMVDALRTRRLTLPAGPAWKPIVILALVQTFGQYILYYLGAAHASSMMVSVLSGTSALLALLISAGIFRLEKMTLPKVTGCLLGFAAIVWLNVQGKTAAFSMAGEGMVLLSQVCGALAMVLIQLFSRRVSPILLSGWQFLVGGLLLVAVGLCLPQAAIIWNGAGIGVVLLLAGVSAGAYTLWGILLSKYPVSSVSVYGCTIGVFGVLFSFVLMKEAISAKIAVASLLLAAGIYLVNRKPSESEVKDE